MVIKTVGGIATSLNRVYGTMESAAFSLGNFFFGDSRARIAAHIRTGLKWIKNIYGVGVTKGAANKLSNSIATLPASVGKGGLFRSIGTHPWRWGAGVAAGSSLIGTAGGIMGTIRWSPREKLRFINYGPGYVTWTKKSGMPHNHLSTDGLPQALSKMRHSSYI